jgi:hypothetical protein
MKSVILTAVFAALIALIFAVAQAGEGIIEDGAKLGDELITNGDFEKGKDSPDGWDEKKLDNLTTFYIKRPGGKGKCLKFDSDVYDKEAKARYKEMKLPKDKRPKAKAKTPTTGPKYNTIGGLGGALMWSEYFDVEHGSTYRIVAEVNTYAPEVKIFTKGYALFKKDRRVVYKKYLSCIPEDKNELGTWKYYSQDLTFQSSGDKYKVRWAKIMIMVYWPAGEAYVDNISVKKVTKQDEEEKKEEKEEEKKEEDKEEDKKEDKQDKPDKENKQHKEEQKKEQK